MAHDDARVGNVAALDDGALNICNSDQIFPAPGFIRRAHRPS